MSDKTVRVRELVEEILETQRSPEEVCQACPELLLLVRQRLQQVRRLDAAVELLLPAPSPETVDAPLSESSISRSLPQVPGYEVLEVLGRGGMGVVYKARQLGLNRTVALKMICSAPGAVPDSSVLARFRTEAEAVARLKHPHIVPVYAYGEHAGQPYFALELIDGTTLARKLDGTPWPPRQAAELVSTLAGAVHYAHQRGILHRDLKPANILLDAQGQPYVTDFGLARDLHGDNRTSEGVVLGTPTYMAPEQASGRTGELSPATDVFGLGAILYQLLTGRPVYQGPDQMAVVKQASRGEVTPPRQVNPRIPRSLAAICMKALAADPKQRYASAAVLEQELRGYLQRPRRLALAAGVAGLLAVVVLVVALVWRPAATPGVPSGRETPAVPVALTGDLNVRIWTPGGKGKRGWKVQEMDRGAVPVKNGEVSVEPGQGSGRAGPGRAAAGGAAAAGG
jgi:predicted Ser/Thr protein kinase